MRNYRGWRSANIKHVFLWLKGVLFVRDFPKCVEVIRGVQTQEIPTFFYGSEVNAPFLEMTHSLLYRESEMATMHWITSGRMGPSQKGKKLIGTPTKCPGL